MTRFFLVDPFPVVRSGICNLLRDKGFHCVGEASTLREAYRVLARDLPDILITEIVFPAEQPWGHLQHLRTLLGAETGLIVFSSSTNFTDVSRAAALGIDDYLPKTLSADRFVAALHAFLDRKSPYFQGLLLQHAARTPSAASRSPLDLLTEREIQVLRTVALGLSNKKIGAMLKISEQTVKEHIRNILRKTSTADRTQAAVWGFTHGIITD